MENSPLINKSTAAGIIIDGEDPLTPRSQYLGAKTITMLGSIALTVNNISGPGMLDFPATFQSAGYIPCIVTLIVVTIVSSACATLLSDSIARIPGNDHFQKRIEFSDVFYYYLGAKWFSLTQIAFYLCLLTQNIAAIVSTAQVLDFALATFVLGKTHAFDFHTFTLVSWSEDECSQQDILDGSCIPFSDNNHLILTLGYLLCALLLLYPGLLNLEENIIMQICSFAALLLLTIYFLVMFYNQGLEFHRVPAFGPDPGDCIGVIIFNFAFCVTVPSWINEKKPSVDINAVVWNSTTGAAFLYFFVGLVGGMAFPTCPDNMLVLLGSPAFSTTTRLAASLFGVLIIGLGIPIFCILMRYNLVVGGIMENNWGTFCGGYLPWLIAWMVYSGHSLLNLLTWTGLILNGFIDFFSPALVALVAVKVISSQTSKATQPTQPNDSTFGSFAQSKESAESAPISQGNINPFEMNPQVGVEQGVGRVSVMSCSSMKDLIVSTWNDQKVVQPTIVNALFPTLRPYHARVVILLIASATLTVFVGLYMKIEATIRSFTP